MLETYQYVHVHMYHLASLSVGVSDFIPSFIAERIINVGMEVSVESFFFTISTSSEVILYLCMQVDTGESDQALPSGFIPRCIYGTLRKYGDSGLELEVQFKELFSLVCSTRGIIKIVADC